MPKPKGYTTDQAAAETGYHVETIRRMIREGKIDRNKDGTIRPYSVAMLKRAKAARETSEAANRRARQAAAKEALSKVFLTRVEAAGIIGCAPRTVDRMIQRGDLGINEERRKYGAPAIKRVDCMRIKKQRGGE